MAASFTSSVGVRWVGGHLMAGADSGGRVLAISTWDERDPPWSGVKPSDLLLLGAAACASYDVVDILTKQRERLESLETSCTGEQLAEPPNTFTSLHLHFVVRGAIPAAKVERAIALSMEKYCSVVITLRRAVEVTYDYELSG